MIGDDPAEFPDAVLVASEFGIDVAEIVAGDEVAGLERQRALVGLGGAGYVAGLGERDAEIGVAGGAARVERGDAAIGVGGAVVVARGRERVAVVEPGVGEGGVDGDGAGEQPTASPTAPWARRATARRFSASGFFGSAASTAR